MSWSRLACLAPLFTAACVDGIDTAHSLAQVDGLEVRLDITSAASEAIVEVSLTGRETCIVLDESFVVRANGWTSDRNRDRVFSGEEGDFCYEPPSVRMVVPPEFRTTGYVEVLDRTRRVALPIGDELQRRTASWVTPADGVLRSGERVEVEWSRREDLTRDSYYRGNVEGDPNGRFDLLPGAVGLTATVPSLSWTVDTQVTIGAVTRPPLRWEVAPGETWTVKVDASAVMPARAVP